MSRCPVCADEAAASFLVRDPVPVHQNLLTRTVDAALALNRGRLDLHACSRCGFVFNAAFDPRLLDYGAAYENTQTCSPAFEAHVASLADHLVEERGLRDARIVEIGCGKGGFLRALLERDAGNRGVGFDPSYSGPENDLGGRLRVERRFFDESCGGTGADAVICRHVIEHIPDPVALLRLVRSSTASPEVRVFFETPCIEWILAHEVIWDVFYEHCSYFSAGSLTAAFQAAGFEVASVRHVFGGQYLWIEATPGAPSGAPARDGEGISTMARRFSTAEADHVARLRARLLALRRDGPVAMWGAAAKGATLASLVDPERDLLACVVDLNPVKQGGYLPGTAHPIVAPAALGPLGVRTAVVTNPNYLGENARLLRQASLDVRLVDLMQPGEIDAHSR